MGIREHVQLMKQSSPQMAASPLGLRDRALQSIKESLLNNKEAIFKANDEDLRRADAQQIAPAVRKRLKFDAHKLSDVCAGIDSLLSLPDPVGRVTLNRELDAGLVLRRVTVPIGVIGIIFEARPDALVQISCLCIKSGNCAVLKGGKIHQAAVSSGLPDSCLLQASAHSEIDELLECDDCVDLLIPRGSNQFVRYIMEHTRIPVAIPILIDAKTQYTAACNAAETLLVNRKIAPTFLPLAAKALAEAGVRLRGTEEAAQLLRRPVKTACDSSVSPSLPDGTIHSEDILQGTDFHKEYLDLVLAVKLVDSVEEAAAHINRYGSHHTDCIVTEDDTAGEKFMSLVDSAGVYRNCSTRFADGFRYGFGAEVGISTGKLHARGPVGLDGLVTYKYRLYGSGQIVGDYASGAKSFHFKDLPLN